MGLRAPTWWLCLVRAIMYSVYLPFSSNVKMHLCMLYDVITLCMPSNMELWWGSIPCMTSQLCQACLNVMMERAKNWPNNEADRSDASSSALMVCVCVRRRGFAKHRTLPCKSLLSFTTVASKQYSEIAFPWGLATMAREKSDLHGRVRRHATHTHTPCRDATGFTPKPVISKVGPYGVTKQSLVLSQGSQPLTNREKFWVRNAAVAQMKQGQTGSLHKDLIWGGCPTSSPALYCCCIHECHSSYLRTVLSPTTRMSEALHACGWILCVCDILMERFVWKTQILWEYSEHLFCLLPIFTFVRMWPDTM